MKSILNSLLIVMLFLFGSGCSVALRPGCSLTDLKFKVYPYLVEKQGVYILTYQIDTVDDSLRLLRVLGHKWKGDKAYYFLSVRISHPEFGWLVRRPLEEDGLTKFAKKDAVYWLNRDGSEVKLKIKSD